MHTMTSDQGKKATRSCLAVALLALASLNTGADQAEFIAPPAGDGNAPYSQAVLYDDFIFLSGTLGTVPDTGTLAEGGIGPETRQTMENIKAALSRVGASMDDVLKCTVFMADIGEWANMNTVYTTYFTTMPARSAVGVNGLALNARVEIECIAAMPEDEEDDE